MQRDIKLSGGEITLLKALGLAGTPLPGHLLLTRIGEADQHELIETLAGLIEMDYVVSTKVSVRNIEDVERSVFRVNSTHSNDLRDAMHPGRRNEERSRRQRRR